MTGYNTTPILTDEVWMARSACKDLHTSLFFDEDREDEAKNFCNTHCTVVQECLDYAFRTPGLMEWGVCGGMKPSERRTSRRRLRAKVGRFSGKAA